MIQSIEKKTAQITSVAYVFMGIVGLTAASLTNSQAILIDGAFNIISAFTMLIAMKTASLISRKPCKQHPYGFSTYETLYSLFKGTLILGVTLLAGFENIKKIILYILGYEVQMIQGGIGAILFYSCSMVVICISTFFYIKSQNNKINNQSTILKNETIALFQNAIISFSAGFALIIITILEGTKLEFIRPIGDSIIVLILVLLLIKDPINILKDAWNELVDKSLDKETIEFTTDVIEKYLPEDFTLSNLSVTRRGRTYFVHLMISAQEKIHIDSIDKLRDDLYNALEKEAPIINIYIETSNALN